MGRFRVHCIFAGLVPFVFFSSYDVLTGSFLICLRLACNSTTANAGPDHPLAIYCGRLFTSYYYGLQTTQGEGAGLQLGTGRGLRRKDKAKWKGVRGLQGRGVSLSMAVNGCKCEWALSGRFWCGFGGLRSS